ncbi:hypothetical protein MBLNU230_g1750t1 [Neophaeotheca triangularis]
MAPTAFTTREREILGIAWGCIKSKPEFDYGKIAEIAGLRNSNSACACLAPILKKLVAGAEPVDSPARGRRKRAAPGYSKANASAKKPREESSADDEESSGAVTPSSAGRDNKKVKQQRQDFQGKKVGEAVKVKQERED